MSENTENTPQLTLADLKSAVNIIEASTSRGAFRAEELSAVGTVYDKLKAFIANQENVANNVEESK